ncbi:MAG: cysteine--1-D-myo-inosityl 2-amino-2-deoxy-alpha-D-glucopyranoside ligase, partial [Propionibacteriaceae bacterium]|nr:cysteine--1-D-myo-inosityl 2-amino-2-deoxy-alpha-D-glucopyranoside ligase [Propionibacteriaceae bacterium]
MRSWSSPVIPPVPLGEPGQLRLYDTAHQAVVPVGPASGTATMYVCGITPYDATHLGHAFTYLTFDLVNRVWRDLGLRVAYAQNVTDVDDPLLERAAATGVDWVALGVAETDRFRADMTALRILAPTDYVKVTDALGLIEAYLDGLRAAGAIYQVDDEYPDWYFAFTGPLGDVSHLDPATMLAVFAERGGDPARSAKRHPLDALVWRQARPGEPAWPSSLGRGRPGWHVQCAAIARATLGDTLDLQGGGADLVFPHHEMCAAEARAATGQPFARALVHSAMVSLGGEKMSKSLGNLVKVSGLVAGGADPMALRLALLAQH